MSSVTWSIGPDSNRALRLLWYAGISVWGGFALLAVALAASVAVGGLLTGDVGPALLVGLLVLVGGPLSLLYLWPMLTDAGQRPAFFTPPSWVRARWLALGTVAVACLVVLVPVAAVGVVAVGLASPLVASLFRSDGELDPESGELTTNGRTVDLGAVAGVSRVRLGSLALCWLRHARSADAAMAPRLLVVPAATAPRLVEAVAASDRSVTSTGSASRSNRLVRAVLLVLGLGSLAVGGVLILVGPVPPAVALWGGALFGLFGGLFLWLAYVEG